MKFLRFSMYDVAKAGEVAQAMDKVWASRPPGIKMLASYVCGGLVFPGVPANTLVGLAIVEAESSEALAAVSYPVMLAGASLWSVPILELAVPGLAGLEKKMRG